MYYTHVRDTFNEVLICDVICLCAIPVDFDREVAVVNEALEQRGVLDHVGARELLELLGLGEQPHSGLRVRAHVELVALCDLRHEVVVQRAVHVAAAEVRVVRVRLDAHLALVERREAALRRRVAHIYEHHLTRGLLLLRQILLVDAVRKRRYNITNALKQF